MQTDGYSKAHFELVMKELVPDRNDKQRLHTWDAMVLYYKSYIKGIQDNAPSNEA